MATCHCFFREHVHFSPVVSPSNSALLALQKGVSAATGKMCSYLRAAAEGRLPCSSPSLASALAPLVMEP